MCITWRQADCISYGQINQHNVKTRTKAAAICDDTFDYYETYCLVDTFYVYTYYSKHALGCVSLNQLLLLKGENTG